MPVKIRCFHSVSNFFPPDVSVNICGIPLWLVCVCVSARTCVRVCMCVRVYVGRQCVHQLSHYCCLFLHLFASLGTTRSHWGHWTSTPAPIYPSLLCASVFGQYNALSISFVTQLCVPAFCTFFLLLPPSFICSPSVLIESSMLHSFMSSWSLYKLSSRSYITVMACELYKVTSQTLGDLGK